MQNLKHIGWAHRLFATDNSEKFPYAVYTNRVDAATFTAAPYFGWLSNEFSRPKLLICPADTQRQPASSWTNLHATNISYFVGLNVPAVQPEAILGGDRNLTMGRMPLRAGTARGTNLATLAWGVDLHKGHGNILMGDGSVQLLSSKRLNASRTNFLHTGEYFLLLP